MTQIIVDRQDIVDKLRTDPAFKEQFLANSVGLLKSLGLPVDEAKARADLESQLAAPPPHRVASTIAVLVTII